MRIPTLLMLTGALFAQTPSIPVARDADLSARSKQLVIDFFKDRGDPNRATRFLADDYVQHNPRFLAMDEVTHAKGRDAWVQANQAARGHARLVVNGGIPLNDPYLIMADGDLVTALYKANLPDPDNPSKTYEAFTFETFRIRDGKFVEHWDGVQLAPGWRTELEKNPARGGRN
jgi:predicted SnoaL-like aldol condensation-catalyzing enzyme